MSSGHHKDAPAPAGAVIRVLQGNPGLRAHVGSWPRIDRGFRVPYLAGSSVDGGTVYIDAQTPLVLPKSNVEVDESYPDHEMFEWFLMVMRGFPYERAHRLAHGYEQMRMRMRGVDDARIELYEAESEALVNLDEHVKLGPEAFPPDLFLKPYEENETSLDERLLPLLKQAQMLRV